MDNDARRLLVLYALLTIPFFLNDFANIYITDFHSWIAVDYLFAKALPLAVVFLAIRGCQAGWRDFGLAGMSPSLFVVYALGMSVVGTAMDQYGYEFFYKHLSVTNWGAIPDPPKGSLLGWFDLHFGLLMVGIVEEIIFRGLALSALRRAGFGAFGAIVVSSVAFGLIHWSIGPAAIVSTGLIGAVFAVCMWRTGSILPLIFAHFVVNYVFYAL